MDYCGRCAKPNPQADNGRNGSEYCSKKCRLEAEDILEDAGLLPTPPAVTPDYSFSRYGRQRATDLDLPYEDVSRDGILDRDGYACVWCGVTVDGPEAHMDHVIPFQSVDTPLLLNPGHVRENIATSCPSCNSSRGNRKDAWEVYDRLRQYYGT